MLNWRNFEAVGTFSYHVHGIPLPDSSWVIQAQGIVVGHQRRQIVSLTRYGTDRTCSLAQPLLPDHSRYIERYSTGLVRGQFRNEVVVDKAIPGETVNWQTATQSMSAHEASRDHHAYL